MKRNGGIPEAIPGGSYQGVNAQRGDSPGPALPLCVMYKGTVEDPPAFVSHPESKPVPSLDQDDTPPSTLIYTTNDNSGGGVVNVTSGYGRGENMIDLRNNAMPDSLGLGGSLELQSQLFQPLNGNRGPLGSPIQILGTSGSFSLDDYSNGEDLLLAFDELMQHDQVQGVSPLFRGASPSDPGSDFVPDDDEQRTFQQHIDHDEQDVEDDESCEGELQPITSTSTPWPKAVEAADTSVELNCNDSGNTTPSGESGIKPSSEGSEDINEVEGNEPGSDQTGSSEMSQNEENPSEDQQQTGPPGVPFASFLSAIHTMPDFGQHFKTLMQLCLASYVGSGGQFCEDLSEVHKMIYNSSGTDLFQSWMKASLQQGHIYDLLGERQLVIKEIQPQTGVPENESEMMSEYEVQHSDSNSQPLLQPISKFCERKIEAVVAVPEGSLEQGQADPGPSTTNSGCTYPHPSGSNAAHVSLLPIEEIIYGGYHPENLDNNLIEKVYQAVEHIQGQTGKKRELMLAAGGRLLFKKCFTKSELKNWYVGNQADCRYTNRLTFINSFLAWMIYKRPAQNDRTFPGYIQAMNSSEEPTLNEDDSKALRKQVYTNYAYGMRKPTVKPRKRLATGGGRKSTKVAK